MSARKKKRAVPAADLSEEMQACHDILTSVKNRADAEAFREPVDWKGLGLPDYPQLIKNPMDLGTIEKNLLAGKFENHEDFAEAVQLVWKNAMTYNMVGSHIYKTAVKLQNAFEKKYAKLNKKKPNKRRRTTEPKEVTRTDRVKFSNQVNHLSSEQLGHIVDIIQNRCPGALNEDDNEVEIEINNIEGKVLNELNEYASQCIARSRKS
mmetsp:Transcript_21753/g.43662  ORF Transcript_21753/g.43662 Transcript_21753/m.43662 type:complete len:208 (-) Transcript_21753:176-799(-)